MMKEYYEDDTFCYEGQWKNDMPREQGNHIIITEHFIMMGNGKIICLTDKESRIAMMKPSNTMDNGKKTWLTDKVNITTKMEILNMMDTGKIYEKWNR